jgi:hypothetical protein
MNTKKVKSAIQPAALPTDTKKKKREGRSRTSMTSITATLHSMMQTKEEH